MNNSRLLTRFFASAVVEGFISLILLLSFSPDPQTSWFLGFSQNRIIMVLVILFGILVFAALMIKAKSDALWSDNVIEKICKIFTNKKFRTGIISFLIILFFGGLFFIYSAYAQGSYVIRPQMLETVELIRAYMKRLIPFVIWGLMLIIQTLISISFLGFGKRKDLYWVTRLISIMIFPLLLLVFLFVEYIDPDYYYHINKEDKLVEWLTFACLVIAGILSLFKAYQAKKVGSRYFWFYLLFGIACIVLGFEEISWGQRVFQWESSDFFMTNSDQQEINVHNVVNKWFDVRTKHVAAFVLFIFGVGLPLLALHPKMKSLFEKLCIVVPPLFLSIGFALGAFLTLDIFSGKEEEIAELFLSLGLLLFIILENLKSDEFHKARTELESQPAQTGN